MMIKSLLEAAMAEGKKWTLKPSGGIRARFFKGNRRSSVTSGTVLTSGGPFRRPVASGHISVATHRQMARKGISSLTRNSKCPCDSGLRFKRCCMLQVDRHER